MKAIAVVNGLLGVLFLAQLILGVLFWTGRALPLVGLHMLLGCVFVVLLWVVAVLYAVARAPRGPAVGLAVLGLIIVGFGFSQAGLMVGPLHWVIRVLHLLLAIAAMAISGRLQASLRAARGAAPASAAKR